MAAAGATPSAVPAKPTGFTATPGNQQVTLEWADPNDSSITSWQYKKDNGAWTNIPNSNASTTTYTVTNLTNDTSTASTSAPSTPPATASSPMKPPPPPTSAPGKPTNFTATVAGTNATLTWTAPSNSTITKWQYRLKQTGGEWGAWTGVPGSTGTTTTYTVPNLTGGIAYTFQVRALNDAVPGPASDEAGALSTPDKPANLQAHPGPSEVTLQWDNPSNTSITSWQYKQDTGQWQTMTCASPCVPANLTMYKVTGLTNNTAYTFKIRAVNTAGNGPESGSVSATPLAVPGAPTNLTATGDNAQVALSWKAPPGFTITKWEYRWRAFSANLGGGSWTQWTAVTPGSGQNDTLTHTVTPLSNNTLYQFQVRASNSVGAGTPAAVSVVPVSAVPNKPANPKASGGNAQ